MCALLPHNERTQPIAMHSIMCHTSEPRTHEHIYTILVCQYVVRNRAFLFTSSASHLSLVAVMNDMYHLAVLCRVDADNFIRLQPKTSKRFKYDFSMSLVCLHYSLFRGICLLWMRKNEYFSAFCVKTSFNRTFTWENNKFVRSHTQYAYYDQ